MASTRIPLQQCSTMPSPSKKVVSASSFLTPESLPPVKSVACYQIMVWTGKAKGMDTTDWGWRLQVNLYVPAISRLYAAPDSLLKVIHCNYSTSCKTLRCSCRRYGLQCTIVCGLCLVAECYKPRKMFLAKESEDKDDEYF